MCASLYHCAFAVYESERKDDTLYFFYVFFFCLSVKQLSLFVLGLDFTVYVDILAEIC